MYLPSHINFYAIIIFTGLVDLARFLKFLPAFIHSFIITLSLAFQRSHFQLWDTPEIVFICSFLWRENKIFRILYKYYLSINSINLIILRILRENHELRWNICMYFIRYSIENRFSQLNRQTDRKEDGALTRTYSV